MAVLSSTGYTARMPCPHSRKTGPCSQCHSTAHVTRVPGWKRNAPGWLWGGLVLPGDQQGQTGELDRPPPRKWRAKNRYR